MGNLLKYFGNRNGDDDLQWGRVLSGHDDMPFRGRAPLMTNEEYESKVKEFCDTKVQIFDLSKPEELAAYTDILDRIANGFCRLIEREKVYDPETKNWRRYMEWTEPYKSLVKSVPLKPKEADDGNAAPPVSI